MRITLEELYRRVVALESGLTSLGRQHNVDLTTGLITHPVGTGAVATDAIWDAKGDLAAATGADAAVRLPVGTNGQVLTADSAQTTGLVWATPSASTAAPFYLMAGQGGLVRGGDGGVITIPVNATLDSIRVNLRTASTTADITFSFYVSGGATYDTTITSGNVTAITTPAAAVTAGTRFLTGISLSTASADGEDLTAMMKFTPS